MMLVHTPYSLHTYSPVCIIICASIRYRCTLKTREFLTRLLYRIAILYSLGMGLGCFLSKLFLVISIFAAPIQFYFIITYVY